jgi:two-component system sensor histidine kinase HydH
MRNLHGQSQFLQLTSLTIVEKDGQAAGRMALIADVSQIKSLQEELRRSERMAALGKMAAGVAHELRNPLSSIKGLALLLRSRFQGLGNDQETADILVQEVERLNRSIGELLAYARPQKLLKQPVQPAEIVEKAVSLIRMDAEAAGILMTTRVVGEAPELLADPDKLNQVLLNLFLNAIQAMPQGGRLDIEIAGVGTTVEIRVQDSGMGISREDLSRVFDPYFTTKAEGTGLGLAMSLKIVEEHEGTITVTSEKNGGSLFVVSLPLNEGQSAG